MASQAIIDALTKQILAQGTKGWTGEGFGSAEANAKDMARILAEAGITDINQFGTKIVDVPESRVTVPHPEGGEYETITPASQRRIYYNKATDQEIMPNYSRAGGNIWSGTFSGKGSTGYGVRFDDKGNPQFYTEYGGTTSDWVPFRENILKPAALAAAAIYGIPLVSEALTSAGAGAGAGAAGAAGGLGPLELAIAAGEGILPVTALEAATAGLTGSQLAALGSGIGLSNTGLLSGITGALSNLTPTQISNLAKAGLSLAGAGAAGSAIGGGGGGTGAVGALPTQAPPGYDQNYFDALNAYYGAYLPGQQANTSMLSSWYNQQPYNVSQFQMPVMASQAAQQNLQQTGGGDMGFFSNLFGSLFNDYLKPNRVIPGAPAPVAPPAVPSVPLTGGPGKAPSMPEPESPFVTGAGTNLVRYGGFATKEEYDRAVATKAAEDAAQRAQLMAYQPTGMSGYGDLYNRSVADPSLLRKFAGETDEDALLRLKYNVMDAEQRMARRQDLQNPAGNLGQEFVITGYETPSQQTTLPGLFQEIYGREGTPQEIANVQGMPLDQVRNVLQTSLANFKAMQNS